MMAREARGAYRLKPVAMVFLAAALCLDLVGSPAQERTPETAILDSLLGSWRGRAVQTPIGPVSYDIEFSRMDDNAVAGVADLGAALHHWRFLIVDGHLRLRFLSTFRGNTRPTWLYTESLTPIAAHFRGRDLDYLTVRVEPGEHELKLDIFLRGNPHVSIRLEHAKTLQ